MIVWDDVTKTRHAKVEAIGKVLPHYDYSSPEMAHDTDESFSSLMVTNLKATKGVMFNIMETSYELHREALLNDFQEFFDAIDVFSDEVKARAFHWDKGKNQLWLEKLVDYDYRIISGLGNLNTGLRALHKEFLSSKEIPKDLKHLDADTRKLRKDFFEIVAMFKERDAICRINSLALEETFSDIQREAREGG